jgi:predicted amidohydrolase YtcJ
MTPDMTPEEWRRRLDEYEAVAFPMRGGLWLSAGILKAFADGVIESRTAAMLAPYEGDTSTGAANWTLDLLDAFVREADDRGWQLEIHAIGDRGVRMTLDAFERAVSANGPRARRHRVEHIETIDSADIPRFGREDVIASMQPYHADPSPNQGSLWTGNIGPERASRAWPWASILRNGGTVAFGSDWPVVPFDPFIALNSAVNRQTIDGQPPGGWLPSERLTLPEALSAYTLGSARAAWADGRRGSIAPGLDADLVVLDRDLLAAGASAIIGTRIGLTVVGGRIVHRTEDVS